MPSTLALTPRGDPARAMRSDREAPDIMTDLATGPTTVAARRPRSQDLVERVGSRHPTTSPSRARGDAPSRSTTARGLVAVVGAGLRALESLNRPGPEVTSGALEKMLRASVVDQRSPESAADADDVARVAAALRVACAHLHAGNLLEARVVLADAHDALTYRGRVQAGTGRRRT